MSLRASLLCAAALTSGSATTTATALSSSGDPQAMAGGPFTTEMKVFSLDSDIQNPEEDKVSVWYPTGVKEGSNATLDSSIKFISYAHGMFGGGVLEVR